VGLINQGPTISKGDNSFSFFHDILYEYIFFPDFSMIQLIMDVTGFLLRFSFSCEFLLDMTCFFAIISSIEGVKGCKSSKSKQKS